MVNETRRLEEKGFSVDGSGRARLSGPAERLAAAWTTYLQKLLEPHFQQTIGCPSEIGRDVLTRAGYLEHFPDQVVEASPEAFGSPAVCFHVYQQNAGQTLSGTMGFWVIGKCARLEKKTSPVRLSEFQMAEWVLIGDEVATTRSATTIQTKLEQAFKGLGLQGEFRVATDAFFLPQSRGSQVMQKLKKLKNEFVVPYGKGEIAVASVNRHETYFGDRFAMTVGGTPAHTTCAAFGIERLTAVGLLAWDADSARWPEALQL